MKRTIVLLPLLVLLGAVSAAAQGGGNMGPSAAPTVKGTVPQAPVGHRQPRAADVPSENNLSNPNEPVNKEDAVLDKKIKSICRGC